MAKSWEPAFPHLGKWEEHSLPTPPGGPRPRYNCYAFAVGNNTQRWEPDPAGQYYWPPTATRAYTVVAFIEAYQSPPYHYEVCGDGSLERGYEKLAIYTDGFGFVKHAASQLSDGRWLSKLGDAEDIIHETPQSVAGAVYGQPVCYMRHPRTSWLTGLYSLVVGLVACLKAIASFRTS
jgi:hypothetical protein